VKISQKVFWELLFSLTLYNNRNRPTAWRRDAHVGT